MSRKPQCVDCKLAEWNKTAAGRLHPSGDGRCTWTMPEIKLPVSFYWIGFHEQAPKPSGGRINRKDQWRQCPFFQKREAQ